MKRIFSKKSGFTLVEIIVAFAVFAIMSAMILAMVKLTVNQQSANNEFADSLEEQTEFLASHYISDADKYGTGEAPDGNFGLAFYDKDGDLVCDVNMDYATRTSVDGSTNESEGVNYFVGNTYYAKPDEMPPDNNLTPNDPTVPGRGNSQASRYDTRITGSRNIDEIRIRAVQKDTSYTGPGVRYFIQCSASASPQTDGSLITTDDTYYLQYKLRFCSTVSSTQVEGKGEDGKTYMYTVPDAATIIDCGYIDNNDTASWSGSDCIRYTEYEAENGGGWSGAYNEYTVTPTSSSSVRIGIPLGDDSYKNTGFTGSERFSFYVVFLADPRIDVNSFGSNASGGKYTAFPIYDEDGKETGGYNANIYGAYLFEKTEVKK